MLAPHPIPPFVFVHFSMTSTPLHESKPVERKYIKHHYEYKVKTL